jgi:hypothetical protein
LNCSIHGGIYSLFLYLKSIEVQTAVTNSLFVAYYDSQLPLAFAEEDISPGCFDEFNTYQDCFLSNLNVCGSCSGEDEGGPTDGDVCMFIPIFCEQVACCGPCISASKAFVNCENDARGCGATCDEVQPVAPSPAAPVAFLPSLFGPVAPTVPCPCDELQVEFALCFFENVLISPSCSAGCQALEEDEESPPPTTCEYVGSFVCPSFTCCPACAAIGNRVVGCFSEELFGCTESVSCGEFAPVAPSPVAPFALPPGLFAGAPVAPPVVAAPAAPLGNSDSSSESSSSEDGGKKGKNNKKGKKRKRALRKGN